MRYCSNNWHFLCCFLLLNLIHARNILPKRHPQRSVNYIQNFAKSYSPLEVKSKLRHANSYENMPLRRSPPWEDVQVLKKLFDKDGVLYLSRVTEDNLDEKSGFYKALKDAYMKRLFSDVLEDERNYSRKREDRRRKKNELNIFLMKELRRFDRETPKTVFQFSELVA